MSFILAIKVIPGSQDIPCHVADLKKGDQFYRVADGKRSELQTAITDPFQLEDKQSWSIESEKAE